MFRVDRASNRISRLSQKRFGDLALREREHLQEWLVHQPDALGEELLILQKEFDGFDATRERLDLLALDKAGNLVVIENKLDDSGRDVTWQALKYAAYVSGFNKSQIADIFQRYLDGQGGGGVAADLICEFLEIEEWNEVVLNPGSGQRVMFVAAHFRREDRAVVDQSGDRRAVLSRHALLLRRRAVSRPAADHPAARGGRLYDQPGIEGGRGSRCPGHAKTPPRPAAAILGQGAGAPAC